MSFLLSSSFFMSVSQNFSLKFYDSNDDQAKKFWFFIEENLKKTSNTDQCTPHIAWLYKVWGFNTFFKKIALIIFPLIWFFEALISSVGQKIDLKKSEIIGNVSHTFQTNYILFKRFHG